MDKNSINLHSDMSDTIKYGAPALIEALDKTYGSHIQKEEVSLRNYPDLKTFLRQKELSQKKSEEIHFVFK